MGVEELDGECVMRVGLDWRAIQNDVSTKIKGAGVAVDDVVDP